MKKNIFYLIILIFSGIFFSCKKDFLEVVDNATLTRQGYVKDLGSMEEYLNGIYISFSRYSKDESCSAYPELISDNLKPLSSPPQRLMAQYTWSQQKSDDVGYYPGGNMNGFWQSSYFIIRACNFIIENVDKYHSENPSKSNQLKGEALTMRALLFFELVNIFSQPYLFTPNATHPGVPYIATSDIKSPFQRQSVSEVYDNMINDLQSAIKIFPTSIVDIKRLNFLAAKALLARVYLFKGSFDQARNMAKEVVEHAPLTTIGEGYPDELFNTKSPGETEVLFQAIPGDIIGNYFLGRLLSGRIIRFLPTSDIVELLEENENDIRSKWVTKDADRWIVTKFPSQVAGLRSIPEADYYQPILRSSEMFLTLAEAYAQTGEEEESKRYLDKVRMRSNPNILPIVAAGKALLDSIYKERRKELSFEGLRMYDLQRCKLPVHRKDALSNEWSILLYPNSKAIAPIPINDVLLAGLPQNIDY